MEGEVFVRRDSSLFLVGIWVGNLHWHLREVALPLLCIYLAGSFSKLAIPGKIQRGGSLFTLGNAAGGGASRFL